MRPSARTRRRNAIGANGSIVARAAFCNGIVSASSVCSKSELHAFTIINCGRMAHYSPVDDGNHRWTSEYRHHPDGPDGPQETGVMTMNSIKTLMLAGVAGLCLALGACSQPPVAGSVQSGSSDVETLSPHNVTTHPQLDFSGADGGSGNQ